MEILAPSQYSEYETFVASHPAGGITQSTLWHAVKSNWNHEVVVSRNADGQIVGGASVLIRRFPLIGTSLLYSPRGPVCDYHDGAVLADLKKGVDLLAKKHRAHVWKMDPDLSIEDATFADLANQMGFTCFLGGDGFETVQARFNYRLYFQGRGEEEILAGFTQMTRRNIRKAQKAGVEIEVAGKEGLDDFTRLMQVTGERDGFSTRPKAYFEGMLDALGDHCRLYLAMYQGKAIAGAVTTNYAGKTCYIYGASDNEHRDVMPNQLMQWEMIRWALETGCTVYDFQGVSGNLSEDNPLYGLYRFKKGFGGTLDELAGEFDYVYRPVSLWLANRAVDLVEWLRKLKRGRS